MDYVGQVPAPPLDRFIDDIYCLTGVPRHRRMNIPPMPSAHLFLTLGEPARLWDSDPSVPPAVFSDGWFMGVWTRRLRNRWVPVDDVWRRSVDRIRNRIGDLASPAATLRAVEDELRSRLADAPSRGLELVQHTGGRLEISHGVVAVAALTEAAGVSGNHLAAQFKAHVGITPKRLARIYRFARLINSVDTLRPIDWSEYAHSAGYFDQAHFSKEFKDFTGHTPTEYLALRRRFPADRDFPPDNGPMPAE
ncbi:helix-turn-helix domain-containing protein [Amycolatopsis orientalis]|uniref:helix-turn-helix domain-containing protein n=1 Tax=Amycolatopsis orientalis TaxID=31958 RepID=UPI000566D590|nr:helix-turn-helix transcriptional regulator [Amycolatopsis orientalis]